MESTPVVIQTPTGNESSFSSSSLLTFVDMALALEMPQADHTYALHDGDKKPNYSDPSCLIQKEKDHNYAWNSKKCKTQSEVHSITRSSSEENLSNVTSTSAPDRLQIENYACGRKSKKSHSLERVESLQVDGSSYKASSWIDDNTDSSLLCSSWPKQNNFNMLKKRSGTRNYVDHTYARENGSCPCDDASSPSLQENSNFEQLSKLSIKSDHAYSDTNKQKKKNCNQNNKSFLKNDHAYDKHFIPPSSAQVDNTRCNSTNNAVRKPFKSPDCSDHNYYNGSVESLDMDLSCSDTDSCDETAQEETNLAFTAWCQLRRDHPYSSF